MQDQLVCEQQIKHIAARIRELGLEIPAGIFLQLHLPVTGVMHHVALFGQPLLSPLFGAERIAGLVELFAERRHVEKLLEYLEQEIPSRN